MRQPAPSIANTFSKGLITETTELSTPENSVIEAYNNVFSPIGYTRRRYGFDYESGYSLTSLSSQTNQAFTEYVWTAVAGDGTISFLVQQDGDTLHFFDISTSVTPSANKKSFTVTLSTYVPSGSTLTPLSYPCQYATGRGNLVVVNRAMKTIYITYTSASDAITVTSFDIQTRDFTGLNDDLGLTTRYTGTVAALQADHPAHYYNLLNQGWGEVSGAALSAWDTARTDMPSNCDYIALYRTSPTSIFDNNRVLAQDPLNTPAAKGHFILTVTNTNRSAAMLADGFSLTLTSPANLISQGSLLYSNWANYGGATAPTKAFDGVKSATFASTGLTLMQPIGSSNGYIGKNFTGASQTISQAIIYGTTDRGFYGGTDPTATWTLYGNLTAPASSTDGTVLGSVTFTDVTDESGGKTITSSDTTTFWNYVWVAQNQVSNGSQAVYLVELELYTPGTGSSGVVDNIVTQERPKTVSFFAGRLFYAGLDALSLNNTIFFTQILQTEPQYGQCYQVNDPTNENIFNLLPSDGGTIVIPEMASVRKLFAYQNALLILASNGVWLITGGSSGGFGGGFQANDYFVKKLSSVGTNSPLSVVDRRGVPLWWGEDGIYTIQYDSNFNSFNVINITYKTIRTFFLAIPGVNRGYAKGTYDPEFDVCYWTYNSSSSLSSSNYYVFDSVLTFNGITQAFSPWTISTSTPQVRGLITVRDSAGNNLPVVKYTTTYGSETLTYSEANDSTRYLDWYTYDSVGVDYSSYFITGYRLETMGERFIQMNYVWLFLETITNSSCYIQGIFDFANNTNSGKWSTPQQAYNSNAAQANNHAVNFRRLKIRGKGRALQLKFYSETGKPYQIQGWALYNTMNQQV